MKYKFGEIYETLFKNQYIVIHHKKNKVYCLQRGDPPTAKYFVLRDFMFKLLTGNTKPIGQWDISKYKFLYKRYTNGIKSRLSVINNYIKFSSRL